MENEDFKVNAAHAANFPISIKTMQVWLNKYVKMTYRPNKKGIAHDTHERDDVVEQKDLFIVANKHEEGVTGICLAH
jgi:hypothetical protein